MFQTTIPDSANPLVIRTNYTSDQDWKIISDKLTSSYEMGFTAFVDLLDDKRFENSSVTTIITGCNPNYMHSFIFIADNTTFNDAENSILCIDLYHKIGQFFRVIPSELWAVENNLSIANMDFQEFVENCDEDGVFRGIKC